MSIPVAKKFPFQFTALLPEETALLKKLYGVSFEFICLGPKGCLYSDEYEKDAENIYNMTLKSDDVVVCTFPRSGKTGGWREYFDEEMSQQAERWIANKLRDTDLRFPHLQ